VICGRARRGDEEDANESPADLDPQRRMRGSGLHQVGETEEESWDERQSEQEASNDASPLITTCDGHRLLSGAVRLALRGAQSLVSVESVEKETEWVTGRVEHHPHAVSRLVAGKARA
jgi:hypothetical protein